MHPGKQTAFVGLYLFILTTYSSPWIVEYKRNRTLNSAIDSSTGSATKSVTYIRATTPDQILECIDVYSILRCMKLFVLQRMERRKIHTRTGNLTRDFIDQFFGENETNETSLIHGQFSKMSDLELSERVRWNLRSFFEHRDIHLHFLPGIMVKIVPNNENKIKFFLKKNKRTKHNDFSPRSLKHNEIERTKGEHKKKLKKKTKTSYKDMVIQMAVPVMVMPAVLLGTLLPFIIPALKLATIMTAIMNNSAFLAALLYAAKSHVMNGDNEPQPVSYNHAGYH